MINVNMIPNNDIPVLHCSEGDTEGRKFEVALHNNGKLIDASGFQKPLLFETRKGGTEQILPENTSNPTISPIIADIQYPDSLRSEQTFLYRESPTTVDGQAKITHIKGNTLVWNQLVQNGDFSSTSVWMVNGASYVVADNVATITSNGGTAFFYQEITVPVGHKCLFVADAKSDVTLDFYFSFGS